MAFSAPALLPLRQTSVIFGPANSPWRKLRHGLFGPAGPTAAERLLRSAERNGQAIAREHP